MRFEIEYRGIAETPEGPPAADALELFLDGLMESLLDTSGVIDPGFGATLSKGVVEASLVVHGGDALTAIAAAGRALDEAIQAAGGLTAAWTLTWTEAHAAAVQELAEA